MTRLAFLLLGLALAGRALYADTWPDVVACLGGFVAAMFVATGARR